MRRPVMVRPALHWAAHWDDEALLQRLIKAGADVNARNDYGATALQEAAERGDAGMIHTLLRAHANVESANDEGQTALMTVARVGSVDAAKTLIKAGADVNAVEKWRGQTALMWASAQGNPEMVAAADQIRRQGKHHIHSARVGASRDCRAAARRTARPVDSLRCCWPRVKAVPTVPARWLRGRRT